MKITPRENHFLARGDFHDARVSLALLSLRKMGATSSLKPTALSENLLSHSDRSYTDIYMQLIPLEIVYSSCAGKEICSD